MNEPHPVYPEGPPCNPHCPGSWSQYHDGYADGYERGEAEAVERWLASPEAERQGWVHLPTWLAERGWDTDKTRCANCGVRLPNHASWCRAAALREDAK